MLTRFVQSSMHPLPCDLVHVRPDASPAALLVHLRYCARTGGATAWEAHAAAVAAPQAAGVCEDPPVLSVAECLFAAGADLGLARVPVPGEPQDPASFDAAHDLACLLANAESEGIAVTWCEGDVVLGGFVYRPSQRQARRRDRRTPPDGLDAQSLPALTIGEFVVVLNPAQDWTTTLDVLLHEVAHVLLGHVGRREPLGLGGLRVPPRFRVGHHAREMEAIAAACVAAWRRGHRPYMGGIWDRHVAHARAGGEIGRVDLRWVFRAADILATWCRMPPDKESVRAVARPRPGPSGPAMGVDPFRRRAIHALGRGDLESDEDTVAAVPRARELLGR